MTTATKKETHTPGPWTFDLDPSPRSEQVYSHFGYVRGPADGLGLHVAIALMLATYQKEEQVTNARLITAAPDLLAALKAIVAVLQKEAPGTPLNNHKFDQIGIDAHNAIAKAEGV